MNACLNVGGSVGLSNELRDVNVLQILGLTYGATMEGGALLRLLLDRVPSAKPVCTNPHVRTSVWWDSCGDHEDGNDLYRKGREMLLKEVQG